jgi:uncharacterized protein
MDEDIERIEPDAAPGVGGVHRGREATLTEVFGRLPDIWDDFAVIPATFIDGGEHVVVLGELSARDPGSGRAVRAPFAHVWRMADGRAVWWRCYEDTALLQGARAG